MIFGVSGRDGSHLTVMILAMYIAAGVLELTGLGFVGYGFYRNWREHAVGQDFWAPPKRWAAHQRRRIANVAKRAFGRPSAPPTQSAGGMHATAEADALDAQAVALERPPDPATHLSEFADKIHRRISKLYADVASLENQLANERDARKDAEAKLKAYVDSKRQDASSETHDVAVSGLRWEFVGWLFLLVGIALGTAGNIAAYLTS